LSKHLPKLTHLTALPNRFIEYDRVPGPVFPFPHFSHHLALVAERKQSLGTYLVYYSVPVLLVEGKEVRDGVLLKGEEGNLRDEDGKEVLLKPVSDPPPSRRTISTGREKGNVDGPQTRIGEVEEEKLSRRGRFFFAVDDVGVREGGGG
jgi:hypothetical protein